MAASSDPIGRLERALERLAEWLALAGGFIVVFLMILITVDALGRKFLQSVPGALEASEALMVGAIFLPLMYVQLRREHVYVTIATQRLPLAVQAAIDAIVALVGFGLFVLITWLTVKKAYDSFLIREFRAGMILFPVWPFRWLIPIGTGFMGLQLAVTFVQEVRNVLHPSEKAVPGELGSDVGEVVPELEGP